MIEASFEIKGLDKRRHKNSNSQIFCFWRLLYVLFCPENINICIEEKQRDQSGFVLPFVLLTIFILSLISVWGMNSVSRAQDILFEMQVGAEIDQSLDRAEQEFLYSFLTASITRDGLDLSGREVSEAAIALGELPVNEDIDPEYIWHANRGSKVFNGDFWPVVAVYQDAESLISLNTTNKELLLKWVETTDASSSSDARARVAKLDDYRDEDDQRQFQGAERADYRMLRLPPPSNTFLRSVYELRSIADWGSYPPIGWQELAQTTLYLNGTIPKFAFMPADLKKTLEVGEEPEVFLDLSDMIAEQLALFPYPGERAQLLLFAISPDNDMVVVRAVEIERTTGAPDRAFTRRFMWERVTSLESASRFLPDAPLMSTDQ